MVKATANKEKKEKKSSSDKNKTSKRKVMVGVTEPGCHRLQRRSGAPRNSREVNNSIRVLCRKEIRPILELSAISANYNDRCTFNQKDALFALKHLNSSNGSARMVYSSGTVRKSPKKVKDATVVQPSAGDSVQAKA